MSEKGYSNRYFTLFWVSSDGNESSSEM